MPLSLRDSLSGRRHTVLRRPRRPLGLYVCGPTVYAPAHVGHGRTYLYFDVLRRTLEERGVPVRHVMNITDVEDKICDRARVLGLGWKDLARREERGFLRDLGAFGIRKASATPRASSYVQRMVSVGRALEKRRRVRRTDEGWVCEPDERLARRNFPVGASLAEHAVLEPGHPFEDPAADPRGFVVWKPQAPPAPSFPSPWGRGVPGWHLECYTMAKDLLGVPVDLHGGGSDLVFPHHFAENVVALTLDGTPIARTFLHTAFVTQDGAKMSKSTGNLVGLAPTVERVGRDALRWYLLTPSYAKALPFREDDLDRSAQEFADVREAFAVALRPRPRGSLTAATFRTLAEGVLRDIEGGLGTDRALARIRQVARAVGRTDRFHVGPGARPGARTELARVERALGIRFA
jgi:cysteinyl-tRNA synthetase